jgi:hypothetical protein
MMKPSNNGATPSRTPARNNYALPHTPIASAKRPRSSMDKSAMKNHLAAAAAGLPASPLVNNNNGNNSAPQTPVPSSDSAKMLASTPVGTTIALDRAQLSPMHPARPPLRGEEEAAEIEIADVVEGGGTGPSKLVDVIFSPMLKFLGGVEGEEQEHEEAQRAAMELMAEANVDDEARILSRATGSNGLSSSHKTVSREDDDDETEGNEDVVVDDMPHDEQQEDAVIVEADDGSSQGSDVDDEEEFNPYAFIKSLPAYEEVKSFCPTDRLPAKDVDAPPISLVLDLDETLVHCTVEAVDDADLTFPVEFHGMTYQVYVRLRPHLTEFLEAIADKFEVIVFTASQQVYADALLNLIDPGTKRKKGVRVFTLTWMVVLYCSFEK